MAARRVDDRKREEGRPGGARRGRAWLCWQAQRAEPAVPARRRQGWKPEGARQAKRRLDAQHDSPARLRRGTPCRLATVDEVQRAPQRQGVGAGGCTNVMRSRKSS